MGNFKPTKGGFASECASAPHSQRERLAHAEAIRLGEGEEQRTELPATLGLAVGEGRSSGEPRRGSTGSRGTDTPSLSLALLRPP